MLNLEQHAYTETRYEEFLEAIIILITFRFHFSAIKRAIHEKTFKRNSRNSRKYCRHSGAIIPL